MSVHLLVECLEALHRVVVGVFGQIVDPGFEYDISTFEKRFMGAMRTNNPMMTPKVYVLIHHVPAFYCSICKVNRVLCVKTWVVPFGLMRAHKQIHFLGVLNV